MRHRRGLGRSALFVVLGGIVACVLAVLIAAPLDNGEGVALFSGIIAGGVVLAVASVIGLGLVLVAWMRGDRARRARHPPTGIRRRTIRAGSEDP